MAAIQRRDNVITVKLVSIKIPVTSNVQKNADPKDATDKLVLAITVLTGGTDLNAHARDTVR